MTLSDMTDVEQLRLHFSSLNQSSLPEIKETEEAISFKGPTDERGSLDTFESQETKNASSSSLLNLLRAPSPCIIQSDVPKLRL
jgi:hypothetical protein